MAIIGESQKASPKSQPPIPRSPRRSGLVERDCGETPPEHDFIPHSNIGAGGFRWYRPNSRATGDSERYCDGNIAASIDGNPALQIKET
ncbi:hypothetical protein FOBRF1_006663 [Fusarium oxysporum]